MPSIFHTLLLLTLATVTLAVLQPPLTDEAATYYQDSQNHVQTSFPPEARFYAAQQRREYYSHLISAHTDGPKQAWAFAKKPSFGPAHVRYGEHNRFAYVTTKIPHDSELAWKWGMNHPQIDEDGARAYRDLYAFWSVSEDGAKQLLRLDAWPTGGQMPQIMGWHLV